MATIEKKSAGSWRIRVMKSYDPKTKKKEYETKMYKPSLKQKNGEPRSEEAIRREVEKVAAAFEIEIKEHGRSIKKEDTLFSDYASQWMDRKKKKDLSPLTVANYEGNLRLHILPVIGQKQIGQIVADDLNDLLDDMSESFSPASRRKVKSILVQIFKKAYKDGFCFKNPADGIDIIRSDKNNSKGDNVHAFTVSQSLAFLAALDKTYYTSVKAHQGGNQSGQRWELEDSKRKWRLETRYKLFFTIAAYTGMRRGEVLALHWDDLEIDPDRGTILINITKSAARTKDGVILKNTKTEGSQRKLKITSMSVVALAKRWKSEQWQQRCDIGSKWIGTDDLIFTGDTGLCLSPDTLSHMFKDLINIYNASLQEGEEALPLLNLHALRHTAATLMIEGGAPVKEVSETLGHNNIRTTENIYTHQLEDVKSTGLNVLSNMLEQKA